MKEYEQPTDYRSTERSTEAKSPPEVRQVYGVKHGHVADNVRFLTVEEHRLLTRQYKVDK